MRTDRRCLRFDPAALRRIDRVASVLIVLMAVFAARTLPAQDLGMTIFNSSNSAAINIAGINAMNSAISSSSFNGNAAPRKPQEPYRWGAGKWATHAQAAPPVTGATSVATLDFRPDQAVTRVVNARFVNLLGNLQPDQRNRIAGELDSGVMQTKFSQLLSSYGYSSRNLADVMTAYLVIAWEVVHNQDATRYIDGIGIVHNQMRAALAQSPNVRGLSDAQKQEVAETLGNLGMLAAVAKRALIERGDNASLGQLQQNVRSTTQKFGVDLASVQLTDAGFVAQ
jgi:hypothetical protein